MTARPIGTQFPGQGCMDDLTTERSVSSQATWVIDVLGLFFDFLSMGVLENIRLVQEFNVCTVRTHGQ